MSRTIWHSNCLYSLRNSNVSSNLWLSKSLYQTLFKSNSQMVYCYRRLTGVATSPEVSHNDALKRLAWAVTYWMGTTDRWMHSSSQQRIIPCGIPGKQRSTKSLVTKHKQNVILCLLIMQNIIITLSTP